MSVAFLRHRVFPHYPAVSDWRPRTPWELVDGRYQRIFASRTLRCRVRKAYIERGGGGWRWRVIEINRERRVTRVGQSAGGMTYTLAYNAFNPAEVSAQTK